MVRSPNRLPFVTLLAPILRPKSATIFTKRFSRTHLVLPEELACLLWDPSCWRGCLDCPDTAPLELCDVSLAPILDSFCVPQRQLLSTEASPEASQGPSWYSPMRLACPTIGGSPGMISIYVFLLFVTVAARDKHRTAKEGW